MGKSIRAKIKKRLRTAKRQRVEAMIVVPRTREHHQALTRVIEGRSVTLARPKSAFRYPGDGSAVFPQHEIMKPIDFRASHLPMASYAFRGNRRKYEGDQAEYMANLAKSSHPQMEVLAGGGAVLSSGRRVTVREAEILATVANNPEAAAAAVATPASAADAVAAAVAEAGAGAGGDVEMAPASKEASAVVAAADAAAGPAVALTATAEGQEQDGDREQGEEPENEADHSRIPVLKDSRRAKRAAEHRPRSNAVKKKTKMRVQDRPATPATPSNSSAPAPAAPQVVASAEPAVAAAAEMGEGAAAESTRVGRKKQAKAQATNDSAEAAAGPATAEPAGAVVEKPAGKGKKKKKAARSAEAADVDMA
uniref:Uncharacterized protein n=1 Tax=Alexandrium monilatum TaxID=311494 RepID=A0A7S4RYV3_9DINO|mmetsp:Transcript_17301/g.54124  ORF Transcript_17301/g.54124 Transcript_17301/m.54124 type:complete len:366 (+) Transcript_17301:99-1196(+)|eukprot:CAMPEP_0175240664 /NCGR_PEP_ID=MMETSP0093-20121207/30170_1 /TAXON_ID=311494 /ORGANISM="Alexandrium monilatum, Strain CCMP3105" /LENGTH=365 /DNA_ID=CAMNT_0016534717 /DNA_START=61 /DNA_END=1158 /DNA_ORIENTATION=+